MDDFYFTPQFHLFHEAYVECAAWTEEISEITSSDKFHAIEDCLKFMNKSWNLIKDLDLPQCGHDFWLTRNGHGSGFWDRSYNKNLAEQLTKISKEFGEYYLEK